MVRSLPFTRLSEPEIRCIEKLHEHRDQLLGVSTGFKDLDQLTSGFQKSDLIILAARPSMGKTALALDISFSAATMASPVPVAFFSLEMSKEQLVRRLMASEGKIDATRLRTGRMQALEWGQLNEVGGILWIPRSISATGRRQRFCRSSPRRGE